MERGLKSARARLKSFGGAIKKMAKVMAVAAAAITAAVIGMVKSYVDAGDWIDKMSKRTGISAVALSELAYAADISGASLNDIEKSVKKMAKTITDADEGLESYLRVFRRLGIDVKKIKALTPEEQFLKIGKAIARLGDESLMAATAQEVFGRAGTTLLPLFKESTEEINRLRKEAHRLGKVFDEEAAAKAAKLKDSMTALKGAFQGIAFTIAAPLVPAITLFVDAITEALVDIRGNAKTMMTSLVNSFGFIVEGLGGLASGFLIAKASIYGVMKDLTVAMRGFIEKLIMGLWVISNVAPQFGFLKKTLTSLLNEWVVLNNEEARFNKLIEDTTTTIADMTTFLDDLKTRLDTAAEGYGKVADKITESVLPPARDFNDVLREMIALLVKVGVTALPAARSLEDVYEAMKPPPVTAWEETLSEIERQVAIFSASWNGMWDAIYQNQMQRIDNEYEARRASIENSAMDEEARARAFERLDKMIEKRRKKVMREQAKAQKVTNLMAAIVNTARAITEALPNIPLAIAVGIMGAIQVLKIATTPLPSLEKGGTIEREGIYRLHPGEEVISAPTVKALTAPGGMGGASPFPNRLYNDITIIIGGERFKQSVVRAVNEASDSRELRIRSHSVVN